MKSYCLILNGPDSKSNHQRIKFWICQDMGEGYRCFYHFENKLKVNNAIVRSKKHSIFDPALASLHKQYRFNTLEELFESTELFIHLL